MTLSIKRHLSTSELRERYEAAREVVEKSHFHALWLLSAGYDRDEVAEIVSFSKRWVIALIHRYNGAGPDGLGDKRVGNGATPRLLTQQALAGLRERIKSPPDDGGLWNGPKVARWLAQYHALKCVHDQRGWDALVAIGYTIQQPRPRHPQAAGEADRAALKKSSPVPRRTRGAGIRAPASRSGRRTSIASA